MCAAANAGRGLLRLFHTGVAVHAKPGTHAHDVVTAADADAEAAITRELTTAFPGSVVVGEGAGGVGGGGDGRWYGGPVGGPYYFLRKVPVFCVAIGVAVRGVPVGGCVYDPVHDELFATMG